MAELEKGVVVNGRYRLLSPRGRGTFGEVWQAEDMMMGMEVAVKVYVSLDAAGREEFKEEYRLAVGLNHSSLLSVTYFDEWEGRPFLVMRYCAQGSVARLAGKMPEAQLWTFIRDVASGLAYLHSLEPEPIVHQDIKPDNILEDDYGHFLITDFGISKKIRATMRKQSGRATGAGAVAYMGPERFSKDPSPIKASDIWSLGVTICELATGELPFCGMGGGLLKQGAALPSLGRPWSEDLNAVMQACLACEPWDRPTAAQLAAYAGAKAEGREVVPMWKKTVSAPPREKKSGMRETHWQGKDSGGSGTCPERLRKEKAIPVKQNGQEKVPDRTRRYLIALFVLCVVGLCLGVFMSVSDSNPLLKEAKAHIEDYQFGVNLCESFITRSGDGNAEWLLKARDKLVQLKEMEEKYSSVMPDYNRADSLTGRLQVKLEEAAAAWAKAARSQYRIKNKEKAKEYYQLALRLMENADLRSEYTQRFPNK